MFDFAKLISTYWPDARLSYGVIKSSAISNICFAKFRDNDEDNPKKLGENTLPIMHTFGYSVVSSRFEGHVSTCTAV